MTAEAYFKLFKIEAVKYKVALVVIPIQWDMLRLNS